MDSPSFFTQNKRALDRADPTLAARISAHGNKARYHFVLARSGAVVPAFIDSAGIARPLHSTVNPEREARRLIHDTDGEGYLIFLGLGGGFAPAAALEHEGIRHVLVIDYDLPGLAELLTAKLYTMLFNDPRFRLIVDEEPAQIERLIKESYQPLLAGGIRLLPLRTRIAQDTEHFAQAAGAVQAAVSAVKGDYATQAFFGKRWFSNTIRNVLCVQDQAFPAVAGRTVTICAAGPSLDQHLERLLRCRAPRFILAVDTSLPVLLSVGLIPDAVISLDAQHISYQHFLAGLPAHTALYLDLAGSPVIATQSKHPAFFAGSHPLSRYISRFWHPLAELDTSGGNVGYAAVSLADYLGAERIELVGADFSYPKGKAYARGTYVWSLFSQNQSRFNPLESALSALVYRSAAVRKVVNAATWYYQTPLLEGYRRALECKIAALDLPVYQAAGEGAPLTLPRHTKRAQAPLNCQRRQPSPTERALSPYDFLATYRDQLQTVDPADHKLSALLATILPTAASFQQELPHLTGADLIDLTRHWCIKKIENLMTVR
ncbi:MAG: DUF115 domain-containing protein [Spirochaetaceae bacterium]|jgi:hypothetical protein|nr:DUF115 domain-containing protein [Spirochaetaceae bacterium]